MTKCGYTDPFSRVTKKLGTKFHKRYVIISLQENTSKSRMICQTEPEAEKKSYVSAVPAGWNFFSAHPGAWEIHYSIFSFHTQIPLLFSALFTLTPAWLNSEVEISGKRNTQSPSISFWQHRIIGKTFFLCLCKL